MTPVAAALASRRLEEWLAAVGEGAESLLPQYHQADSLTNMFLLESNESRSYPAY